MAQLCCCVPCSASAACAALPTLCRARAWRFVTRPTKITQRVCHRLTGRYEGRSVLVRPRPSRTSSANLDGNLTCIWITPLPTQVRALPLRKCKKNRNLLFSSSAASPLSPASPQPEVLLSSAVPQPIEPRCSASSPSSLSVEALMPSTMDWPSHVRSRTAVHRRAVPTARSRTCLTGSARVRCAVA